MGRIKHNQKTHLKKLFYRLAVRQYFNWMPDKLYLKLRYKSCFGVSLNLDSPQTYTEKLQWLKLYDRKPHYPILVDKYAVRDFIAQEIGKEYLVPLIGVWDRVEDIDWDSLPNQFVMKCTHGQGCNIICTSKKDLSISEAKRKISAWMQKSWFWIGRAWPYKEVKPRILCEAYLASTQGISPKDYKILCFMGEPKLIQVHLNRYQPTSSLANYTPDWKKTEIRGADYQLSDTDEEQPDTLEEMLNLARQLATNMYFARLDFYSISGKIYFGEYTLYPGSGLFKY